MKVPVLGTPVLGTPGLWFAALGGAGAYAVHLVAGFWLVPVACRTGTVAWLHALGAVTLTVAVAATTSAVLLLRAAHRLEPGRQAPRAAAGGMPDAVVRGVLAAMLLGRVRLAGVLLVAAAARLRGAPAMALGPPAQPPHPRGPRPPSRRQPPSGVGARVGPWSAAILAGDHERVAFMARVGVALGVVSVLLVVAHWVPVELFSPCR